MSKTGEIETLLYEKGLSEKDLATYLEQKGWGCEHPSVWRIDLEKEFLSLWEKVKPYTMISMERGYAVYQAVRYIAERNIPGDIVECGVWKGGGCMLMAHTLAQAGISDRKIWLYDTFEGMTEPGPEDRIASSGQAVSERWHQGWWAVGTSDVRNNMESTGYPPEMIELVRGDVCKTLNERVPGEIALLRLDTDWYESTKAELEILYPKLSVKGVLIIDDYGHFSGSRQAVDEYFSQRTDAPLLQRSDYTGRLGIKTV